MLSKRDDINRKLVYALSRITSEDAGLPTEIKEILQGREYIPDIILTVQHSISEVKPMSRRLCVGMLAVVCEIQPEEALNWLPKILNVIVELFGPKKCANRDTHLRDALCETLARIASVCTSNGCPLLTILKPLFQACSTCHDKFTQQGAAMGIASVLSGADPPVLQAELMKVLPKLLHYIGLPLIQCRVALLHSIMVLIQACPMDFEPGCPALLMVLPLLEVGVKDNDWQTRLKVVDVSKMLGDRDVDSSHDKMGDCWRGTPVQKQILKVLQPFCEDKVRQVREGIRMLKGEWEIQSPTISRRGSIKEIPKLLEAPRAPEERKNQKKPTTKPKIKGQKKPRKSIFAKANGQGH